MKNTPIIGGHVSAVGGIDKAVINAQAIGAQTFQIHATSPRQWQVRVPDEKVVTTFLKEIAKSDIKSYYIHAPYLINLATVIPELLEKSYNNLKGNYEIGQLIHAKGVVYHLGSFKGWDKESALQQQITTVKKLLANVEFKGCSLLLENSAGGGDKLGVTVDELAVLINGIDDDRVGICLDTAHAYEAGILTYDSDSIKLFFDEFDQKIGMHKLICLHVNDSKTEFESLHDRHDNLGEGFIGLEGFKALAKEERLFNVDWCLETPGFDGNGPDKENMEILKKCFS